ncbi:baseplate J/gp47 family protein [Myxococcota bacterium]|nr:baseplate J/gp47 family protein [Myxococcota bacterium]
MPLPITDFDQALDEQLDAYRNRISGARIEEGSEIHGRAVLGAVAVAQLGAGLFWVRDQAFPTTADTVHLERHAALVDLQRKPAATAAGTVTFTGTSGVLVPAGTLLTAADGTEFVTSVSGTLASGTLTVAVEAVLPGTAGNRVEGDVLEVAAPPSGVDADAEVVSITGGTEEETDAALRSRVLTRLRSGDGGGTLADFERWASEVAGVSEAHALRWRRGPGTVSVCVFEEVAGRRTPAGFSRLAEVEAVVAERRPTCAEVDVIAADEVAVDVEVSALTVLDGYDAEAVQTAVQTAVEDYLYSLRTGDTVRRSALAAAVSAVPGVLDFSLDEPAANVAMTVDLTVAEVAVPGSVAVELA